MKNKSLSIVIPCFNEEGNILKVFTRISNLNLKCQTTIIFVDDGSIDSTWINIEKLMLITSKTKVLGMRLTRNFGKESAMIAGLKRAKSDYVVTIDCDLQHPPELISDMLNLIDRNPDVHIINAVRDKRQDENRIKLILVNIYYFLLNKSTGLCIKNHSDFKLLDNVALKGYLLFTESNKFYRGLTQWLGYSCIDIKFKPLTRFHGYSSWSFLSLFRYAKSSILSFSYLPLKFITWIGTFAIIFSLVLSIDTLWKTINGKSAEGFPTIILLQLGMGSLILFSLGLIAEYLTEIYRELKKRPQFIIDKIIEKNHE